MVIQTRKPDKAEIDQESEQPTATEQGTEPTEKLSDSAELIDGMRPELKKAIDRYKEFME